MATEVRLLELNEYPAIASFIDRNWKKDHAYVRSKDLFNWTFRDNPAWNKEDGYSFSVAVDDGSIIGMLGAIPFKLNVLGKNVKACWLVNWIVMPEVKGGKGLALLNFFSKEQGFNTISFGINDKVAGLYKALEWQEMPPIPRMEWVNPDKIKDTEDLLGMTNPEATAEQILKYISKVSGVTFANDIPEAYTLNSIDADVWDRTGWSVWNNKSIGCAREYSYLNWRYLQHPIYKYETRVIAEGGKLGLIIWRIEITRKMNSNGTLENYLPFVRIAEFLPVSETNARELISCCLVEASVQGVVAADFYCYNLELIEILQRIGFSISGDTSCICLPNHTQPIGRGSNIRSTIKTFSCDEISAQDSKWYWTRSDSDQDRPN
ncbi:MAG: GNAT family N-acetyltransferase [Candidatus Scalindua sp.]|jgi:hypothetical protein|nr:GNAT family N-acetyltransferase [Candidatus Scalindua sp.]